MTTTADVLWATMAEPVNMILMSAYPILVRMEAIALIVSLAMFVPAHHCTR